MLNRIASVFIIFVLFTSCDKDKHVTKKLIGEWHIVDYKKTDQSGLSEYAVVSGNMIFEKSSDYTSPSNYSQSIIYAFPSNSGTISQHGTIEVVDNGGFMNVTSLDNSNMLISTIKYRILVQTSTDLELEYTDASFNVHNLIFKKKK